MAIFAQLSCEMSRDPRMIAAGWQSRAVYMEAILYCRENLTDGIIDRLALVYWMPDMGVRTRVKWLDRLVEVGALDHCDQGWRFPPTVWGRWNPSRAEVVEKREAEAQRKAEYRARRKAAATEPSENVPTGHRVPATSRPRQPESESESEPEPEPESVRRPENFHQATPTNNNRQRINQAIDIHARTAAHQRAHPKNQTRYANTIRTNDQTEHGPALTAYAQTHPDATPEQIAQHVLDVSELDIHRLTKDTA